MHGTEQTLVIHAEMPQSGPGIPDPRGLQLWVDLPKEFKMVEPSYQELGPKQYVRHEFGISLHILSTLYQGYLRHTRRARMAP